MKASELIKKLQKSVEENGDLDVIFYDRVMEDGGWVYDVWSKNIDDLYFKADPPSDENEKVIVIV